MTDYEHYRCTICNGAVVSEDAWVETDVTGRVWFCAEHWDDAGGELRWSADNGLGYLTYATRLSAWKLWPRSAPREILVTNEVEPA